MTALILVILAGITKAVIDTLAHHYSTSIFRKLDWKYWNPLVSCNNKYKNKRKIEGEKFLGSTTVFMFLTDAWHLFQFFFLNLMIISIFVYEPIINIWFDIPIFMVGLKGTFELFYKYILIYEK